jgi:hypothetical protein
MKNIEFLSDFISVLIGMAGALLKGFKVKMHPMSVILSMIIAGIFSFSTIGIIETFFNHLSPKIVVLIAFCVGWVANEITSKLDEFVNDFYEIILDWIKAKFKIKNKDHE